MVVSWLLLANSSVVDRSSSSAELLLATTRVGVRRPADRRYAGQAAAARAACDGHAVARLLPANNGARMRYQMLRTMRRCTMAEVCKAAETASERVRH